MSTKPKTSKGSVSKSCKQPAIVVPEATKATELASFRQCITSCRIDRTLVSTSKQFVDNNAIGYYIIINTWLFQVEATAGFYYGDLLDHMLLYGLIPTINDCNKVASDILSDADNYTRFNETVPPWLVGIVSGCPDLASVLQILRYPKRYCPLDTDIVRDRGLNNFLQINNRCKVMNKRFKDGDLQCHKWAWRLSKHIYAMLDGYQVDLSNGKFSNGVAGDAEKPLASKLLSYAKNQPHLSSIMYPLETDVFEPLSFRDYSCSVKAVPKSYKTPRIIAMEPSFRQFNMQAMRLEIERRLIANGYAANFLNVRDQRPNREKCFDGSVSGLYATIDLSSASDSLSRALVFCSFPGQIARQMDEYLSREMRLPSGNRRKVHMFSTSGSALTFIVESMMFLAICLECADIYTSWNPGCTLLPPQVFGDDMIVDKRLFATVVDVLTLLGFTTNVDKSFYEGGYRESCGVEYHYGIDTHTRYFPRKAININRDKANTVASLCSLEHKLYNNPRARQFLCTYIRFLEPNMTSHGPGIECSDLWEPTPIFKTSIAPNNWKTTLSHLERDAKWEKISAQALENYEADRIGRKPKTIKKVEISKDWVLRDRPWLQRELHWTLQSEVRKLKPEESALPRTRNVEMWRYHQFLRFGPVYEDLGIGMRYSKAPAPIVTDLVQLPSVWRYSKE